MRHVTRRSQCHQLGRCEEYERRLAKAEADKALALKRQAVELTGSVEEVMAMRAERDKEERLTMLSGKVARRIMNTGLASGWSAWYEMWEAKTYAMGRLRQCGNRLHSPALAEAFGCWRDTVEEEARRKEVKMMRQREAALKGEQSALGQELERVKADYERQVQIADARIVKSLEEARGSQRKLEEARGSQRTPFMCHP